LARAAALIGNLVLIMGKMLVSIAAKQMTYLGCRLRLASHLSSDHLLDPDHYLDWILSSLQNCDLDILPIWMLVMQIHRQELLGQRQRGKRLVEALVGQLYKVCGEHCPMVSYKH